MKAKNYSSVLRAGVAMGFTALLLSACGGTKWGFPYKTDVQQGNWITSEQVEQLRVGMTREQVRYVLGTPTLQDIFHSDRWDYPYYNQPGYGKVDKRLFTVWFDGNTLVRWDGDNQPNHEPFQNPATMEPDSQSGILQAIDAEPLEVENPNITDNYRSPDQ